MNKKLIELATIPSVEKDDYLLAWQTSAVANNTKKATVQMIFDLIHPVDEVYTQYPNQQDPNTLYGDLSVWTEITSNYAGLFFRAEGGNSEAFGTTQNEELPNVSASQVAFRDTSDGNQLMEDSQYTQSQKDNSALYNKGRSLDWSGSHGSLSMTSKSSYKLNELALDLSRSSPIYKDGGHVTPVNTAIRIWKRTA